ncbi:LuxR C-terminal-related transcriptional regulator [Polynucleobacter sp. MWH-HuK1]|uniref:LuxR C-terminal-related transcriptional regulator n=1 Tax=Polynucleobacter sp. MWH-HuK1 TaxID=1743158 RepID=UPI001C0B87AD|nr:hypothetical protein [Polynucleobacter sp. MWH-HuK1]
MGTTILNQINQHNQLLIRREIDVLNHICADRINKVIGSDFGISVKALEAHRANLMDKLKVNRTATLLQLALRYQEAKIKDLFDECRYFK